MVRLPLRSRRAAVLQLAKSSVLAIGFACLVVCTEACEEISADPGATWRGSSSIDDNCIVGDLGEQPDVGDSAVDVPSARALRELSSANRTLCGPTPSPNS